MLCHSAMKDQNRAKRSSVRLGWLIGGMVFIWYVVAIIVVLVP